MTFANRSYAKITKVLVKDFMRGMDNVSFEEQHLEVFDMYFEVEVSINRRNMAEEFLKPQEQLR